MGVNVLASGWASKILTLVRMRARDEKRPWTILEGNWRITRQVAGIYFASLRAGLIDIPQGRLLEAILLRPA